MSDNAALGYLVRESPSRPSESSSEQSLTTMTSYRGSPGQVLTGGNCQVLLLVPCTDYHRHRWGLFFGSFRAAGRHGGEVIIEVIESLIS